MDETHSESDVSLSPSQILERLQVLRQLQLMQRGNLQKLQYKETSESSSSITEIVSSFSNSTSYNTFRSLLQSSNDISNEGTPRLIPNDNSQKVQEKDLIDGVSVLNLSQESEYIVSSPLSSRSRASASSKGQDILRERNKQQNVTNLSNNTTQKSSVSSLQNSGAINGLSSKQISLDEMPILSPKKNFETLLLEKLQNEKPVSKLLPQEKTSMPNKNKKPFLRKGEGIARFGLKKNVVVIQNTKSLPWKKNCFENKSLESPLKQTLKELKNKVAKQHLETELLVPEIKLGTLNKNPSHGRICDSNEGQTCQPVKHTYSNNKLSTIDKEPKLKQDKNNPPNIGIMHNLKPLKAAKKIEFSKNKHPLVTNKGKTWAAVLTKEQSDFLWRLKQSDYYKNFSSPTKSIVSDTSCDETMSKIRQEKEVAEQNMFDLLENKVSHESFNLENSFFNCFLRRSNLECSGESTPMVMQKCISENPDLMHILPGLNRRNRNETAYSDVESCCSNTDCCSEACSSVSSCSCKTIEQSTNSTQNCTEYDGKNKKSFTQNTRKVHINTKEVDNKTNQDDTMTENDTLKANMAEMNAKLVATSELLKDRLCELEDEIETFRKENANLAKLRDEVDQDRQKFYEEKAAFEQKYNEEKVLAEYYLAEEKDKLSKQKQMYDRYVREMRGRLNKKDKDEVINLKKEIGDLKEEIRMKDAKSTSTIARLRNQIKIMEKEKKELQDEVEKLKKQNRRIQHSNEVTRRLTNIKYLEEINKKLNNMSNKESRSEVCIDRDVKYKAHEIERQSRSRRIEPAKNTIRPRAKSVPNINVTSRYAKYFSQRDTVSQTDQARLLNTDISDDFDDNIDNEDDNISLESHCEGVASNIDDNYLEKIYMERFKSNSPKSNRSSDSNSKFDHNYIDKPHLNENAKDFFIQKSNSSSIRNSKSPRRTISPNLNMNDKYLNRSKSPISILSNKSSSNRSQNSHSSGEHISSHFDNSHNRSKSPVSAFNHSSLRSATVILNNQYGDKLMSVSPEPISKTNLTKTNLNPTELRNSDGSRELRFSNGNVKYISEDGKYTKFVYYNGDVKENFLNEGRIKYFYAETKTYHTTHADGLEVLEFPDGQVEKRYKDGSSEIRLPNGSIRYFDPKNEHVREEWRFPDGAALTVAASGERRVVFSNGQVEVHAKDHKRREFPDGTIKLVYNDGTSETRYASGRVRIKDKHGNLIMDSASG